MFRGSSCQCFSFCFCDNDWQVSEAHRRRSAVISGLAIMIISIIVLASIVVITDIIVIILIDIASARPSTSLPSSVLCIDTAMVVVQNRMPTPLCELGGLERRCGGYRARIPGARIPLRGNAATHRSRSWSKPLSELGSVQRRRNGFRAHIRATQREQHIGPLRDTEAEALSDLAEMRGVTSRAELGLVTARLRAGAVDPREVKPLCELGGIEHRPDGYRARMGHR